MNSSCRGNGKPLCTHREHAKGKGMVAYEVFLSAASWHWSQLLFAVDVDVEEWKGQTQLKPDKQAASGNEPAE